MRRSWTLLLVLVIGACSNNNMSDLRSFVAEVKARPPGGISPAPEPQEVKSFVYDPKGRRDPFQPQQDMQQKSTVVNTGIHPDFNRRKEALEQYSLDSLRMVGTLQQDGTTWGLVETKDGTIHRVTIGNYMGRNYGRIVKITEDKIKLIELVPNGTGGYREQEAALALGQGR